jgi:hypothetical protein
MADQMETRFIKALGSGAPTDMAEVRLRLDATELELKDSLLRQVHQQMATDLLAIWEAFPGAPSGTRPN